MHFDQALFATIDSVLSHCKKANVPTIVGRNNIGRVIKSYYEKDYMTLMKKNANRRRVDDPSIKKFKSELDLTMKFYKTTVLKDMAAEKKGKTQAEKEAIDVDIKFMESMLRDRIATYSGVDRVVQERAQIRQKRQEQEERQETHHCADINDIIYSNPSSSSCEDENNTEASTSEPNRKHRRTVKSGVHIFVPHNILESHELVSCSLRNNISPTKLSSIVHSLVSACDGDPSKLNLNARTAHRYRTSILPDISLKIKSDWQPTLKMIVHWDGKLMDTLDSKGTDDRMPILVSGVNGTKLLGAPALPHPTKKSGLGLGVVTAKATKALLDDWGCEENIIGMVFDTTASNTGQHTGACVSLQKELDHGLLWFACRRHVGEVILSHCWECLKVEASASPNVSFFQRFKKHFSQLPSLEKTKYHYPEMPGVTNEHQQEIADFFRESLLQNFARGDYKELVELCLLLVTKGSEPINFKMRYPGALHKARWMAKLLYAIKIVILSEQIQELFPNAEIVTNSQLTKLERFVVFTVAVYVQWWIVCPVPASAPVNDLILVDTLDKMAAHDPTIVETARKSLTMHTWYLTEELIPLALFSPMVSEESKDEMRKSLLQHERSDLTRRVGLINGRYGKPYLPSLPESGALVDLIGPDSFRFFTIMGVPYTFLGLTACEWKNNDHYYRMKQVVDGLQVVNEAAERGVKLCHDFLDVVRNEKRFQDILQVVESDRQRISDQRKRSSASKEKSWFLTLENE